MITSKNTIYTIGHSTHSFEDFMAMLNSFNIKALADIRSYPGSKRYPDFNKENLFKKLPQEGIRYFHLEGLGGRRKVQKNSRNNRWRSDSFRGYADYMETEAFHTAISELESIAIKNVTAYMCAEAVWWRCHRSLVSDYLKAKGWKVMHIMSEGKAEEHTYTSPAVIKDGKVLYFDEELF